MLGLPEDVIAVLFDLDGVLTRTALVHNAAWTQTFDAFLRRRAAATGEPFRPFDPVEDYLRYVDGRARADGVRTFLASRGITLPEGTPADPPTADTVHGIGNRKNLLLLERLRRDGVQVYPGSVAYLRAAVRVGLPRAVVSVSANCAAVLAAAGLDDLVPVRVDGVVARRDRLRGKPEPDMFLTAAAALGVPPCRAVVFEDALSGVAAGRAGGFGYVVGVNRADQAGRADRVRRADRVDRARQFYAHGADRVVGDLAELLGEPTAGNSGGRWAEATEPGPGERT